MRSIQELKDEKPRLDNEPSMETLAQAAYRWEVENEANRMVENYQFRAVFGEIKKDEELANIVKCMLPNHLKTSLLSGTVSSQIKKKENQEQKLRRELSKQPHLPVYDYDNKFVYKKYLRDDKVPAFISTKVHATHKKELDLEKVDVNDKNTSVQASYSKGHSGQKNTPSGSGRGGEKVTSNDNSPKSQLPIVQEMHS